MAIGSEGADLAIYLALLIPLEYLMKSARVAGPTGDRRRGVYLAGGILALVSAVKIGMELTHKEPSYYDMMEVLPTATSAEVKRGYKQASLKVHPDKLRAAGGADADEEGGDEAFMALKAAYDVLSDSHLRDMYNKFGVRGLDAKDDTTSLLAVLGFFYVVWLAVAYLLTQAKGVARAQTWTFTGLMALGIFEYQTAVAGLDFLADQMPQLAMFEKVELLHRVYPAYLLGARLVAHLLYEDVDRHNFMVLQHLHAKTDRLLIMIRQLQLGLSDGGAAAAAAAAAGAKAGEGAAAGAAPADPWGLPAEALQQQYRPLHPAALGTPPPVGGVKPGKDGKPAAPAAGGRNLGSLVWFFGVYFFFQWLLGRGS